MQNITSCPNCCAPVEITEDDELVCDYCGVAFNPTDDLETLNG